VVVGVGETIPVDGRVIDGAALVNQAAVTGEDVPVRKEAPRRVVAGSTLIEGRLRIQATQVGADTTTARIARFIQESLGKHITHGEVDYLVAHGMAAQVNGQGEAQHIRIGIRHYLEEHEGISFDAHAPLIERLQEEGKTLLYDRRDRRQRPSGQHHPTL
jgi:magnesium-transporting ATPase (P-type)